jgi:hypothetical protein
MKHSNLVPAVALGVLGAGLVTGLATGPATGLGTAPALASGPWEQRHFEWGETIVDFCDVPGLTVEDAGSGETRSRTVVRGGVDYGLGRSIDTDVYTNLANGRSVTNVQHRHDEDYVTDNGDGTVTLHYFAVARNTAYDDDGNVIARDAGTVTVESVWDQNGTPDNVDDDFPLSFEVLKSTGKRYDFCGVLVPALS